jgi:hypothetical protein
MAGKRAAGKPVTIDPVAIGYATRLIHQVCCFAGSFDLVEEFRNQDLSAAVERRDSTVLFDRLIYDFSFQGISDQIAIDYMHRHGQATWRSVRKNLASRPTCPKLQTYWHFHGCRYEKISRTCAEPNHIASCPLPTHRLRNGHRLSLQRSCQMAGYTCAATNLVLTRSPRRRPCGSGVRGKSAASHAWRPGLADR